MKNFIIARVITKKDTGHIPILSDLPPTPPPLETETYVIPSPAAATGCFTLSLLLSFSLPLARLLPQEVYSGRGMRLDGTEGVHRRLLGAPGCLSVPRSLLLSISDFIPRSLPLPPPPSLSPSRARALSLTDNFLPLNTPRPAMGPPRGGWRYDPTACTRLAHTNE